MAKLCKIPDSNHINRSACEEVDEIIKPLKDLLGINGFCYHRIYYNGTMMALINHRQWNEYYWNNNCHQVVDGIPWLGFRKLLIDPYISPESLFYQKFVHPAQNIFDLCHDIKLFNYHLKYCEMYSFVFPKQCTRFYKAANEYLDNLQQFNFYFKNKAMHLIKEHEQHRFMWGVKPGTPVRYSISREDYQLSHLARFLDKIKTTRFYLEGDFQSEYLTRRELECLQLIRRGLRAKEIARELQVGVRTVEKYMEILKEKFHCKNKKTLQIIAEKILEDNRLDLTDKSFLGLDSLDEQTIHQLGKAIKLDFNNLSFYREKFS